MKISIITLFPEVFDPILNSSILKRAQKKGLVEFELINLRDFGQGSHKTVDDRPFGGGAGMVLKADVLAKAVEKVKTKDSRVILTSASGKTFNQKKVKALSKLNHLVIICGHYEGVDQRFIEKYVDEEISIGDYILTGGEIPAMVIADSITRLIPGVLKKSEATKEESFSTFHLPAGRQDLPSSSIQLLEYPHYTRPEEWEGEKVPSILLSGNHQEIKKWREKEALEKTRTTRPDLLRNKKHKL